MNSTPTDLFPEAVATSPRASWLNTHGLIVRDYQDRHSGGFGRHSLNDARFLCATRSMTRYASGDTQDAAEQAYCERYGLTWWKLADWNGAMASASVEEEMAVG